MHVAVVGMGNMGRAFAARSIECGHQVTVWNRSAGRADELVERGAREADSPAAAASDADVVLVVLTDDGAVEAVCLGDDGVVSGMAGHTVLANVSTVSPALARRLADAGPEGRVLDLPVLGSPDAVRGGKGRFLVGGPGPALATIEPILADLGASTIHCGPSGTGAVMKLVCNLLLVTGVAAVAEGVSIARGQGIGDDMIRTVLGDAPVVSPASRQRLEPVLDADHQGWFGPALARKDVRLAVELARQSGAEVRLGPAADELLTAVIERGRDWPDLAAVIEAFSQ